MYPNLDGGIVSKLAQTAKRLHGGKDELDVGEVFAMPPMSPQELAGAQSGPQAKREKAHAEPHQDIAAGSSKSGDADVRQVRNDAWLTLYEPVGSEGGNFSHYRGFDLTRHTLQKFLDDPVGTGWAAAAVDARRTGMGTMFDITNFDQHFKDKLAELKQQFGDAYEKKYGRPLDHVYFAAVDTGVHGYARADICVDPGTVDQFSMFNTPDGPRPKGYRFTMQFLNEHGRPMTIDS